MSKVNPIKFNNIIFSTDKVKQAKKNVLFTSDTVSQTTQMPSVHNASSQINARTPVSYSKIAEIPIFGVENNAQIYKLSNGQKVVIVKKDGPTVVQTSFKTGGFNEPDNLRGISHFIEHNLFNGSERLQPGEYNKSLAQIGAYTNAYTSNNTTAYYAKSALGQEYLEDLIRLNAEQTQFPTFPIEQIEKEKGIVCSEINMYQDNMPNIAKCSMIKELFQINSTSTDLVAGNIDNINALTREDLIGYFNTYYSPDNAITTIVGDIDTDEAIKLASKYYTKQNPIKPTDKNHEVLTPIQSQKRVDLIRKNALASSISVGFAGPENINTKDRLALSLAINLLEGSKNSKLTKALDKLNVKGQFEFEEIGNQDSDRTCLSYNITSPESSSEKVLSVIFNEITDFINNPPSNEDFETAKRRLSNSTSDSNETSEQLTAFIGDCMRYNKSGFMSNYKAEIDSLTINDVISAAAKYMNLQKAAVCVVHPKDATEKSILENYHKNISSSDVSFKGRAKSNKPLFEKVREYTIPNKMSVAINPAANTDKVIFTTKYTHPILSDMTSAEMLVLNTLLNSGSMYNDEQTFSEVLDKRDTEMLFEISPSEVTYSVRCPENQMQNSFNSLREVMFAPRFTQENLEKAITKVKNTLSSTPQSPSALIEKAMFPNLKVGQTNKEMISELDNLSLARITDLYSRMFQNTCATSVLTAPTDRNPILENIFTFNLMSTPAPTMLFRAGLNKTYSENATPKTLCYAEDNIQANVLRAYKFKRTGNIDDKAKISLLNVILGGGMNSRLFLDLREKQKLAYSVGTGIEGIGDTEYINFGITTTTNNPNDPKSSPENITKALEGFDKHIDLIKTEPVSEKELESAKLILKNDLLEETETRISKTVLLSESKNSFYGKEELKQFLDAIDKVTPEDIRACAKYVFAQAPITSIVASKNTLNALNLQSEE